MYEVRGGESDPLQEGALLDDILGHARRVSGRHTQQTQRLCCELRIHGPFAHRGK